MSYNYSKEFLQKTISFWQPYSKEKLTEEDAKGIIENVVQLFDLLNEIDGRQKDACKEVKSEEKTRKKFETI